MAVRHRHHIRAGAKNLAVQIALDEAVAAARIDGVAVEVEFHDVVGRDHLRRQRARHQEALGMAGMAHGDVAGGVEHALVRQDAARRRQIFQRGAIDGAAGHAHK